MSEFSLTILSRKWLELIPITDQVRKLIHEHSLQDGWLHFFVPHTTAAITINEQADPDVAADLQDFLSRISPAMSGYRHMEGNSHAHALSSLLGVSLLLPLRGGQLHLGKWQGLFFCEFDGPRNRTLIINYMPA